MAYVRRMPPRDRTRRRATPQQERAHASIEAILGAAALLVGKQGFARTTTNQIAARAGVNVALVYRYFAGKEAILAALVEREANATVEAIRGALAAHAEAPLRVAVRALLAALVGTPRDPALHRELVENLELTRRRALVGERRAAIAALFSDFLARRGAELRPLADRQATLFVVEHAIEATTHAAAFYRPDGLSLERTLDALADLVARALLA